MHDQVNILGAICMLISSWKSSLHAYGRKTCEILVLFRQPRHSKVPLLRLATGSQRANQGPSEPRLAGSLHGPLVRPLVSYWR